MRHSIEGFLKIKKDHVGHTSCLKNLNSKPL